MPAPTTTKAETVPVLRFGSEEPAAARLGLITLGALYRNYRRARAEYDAAVRNYAEPEETNPLYDACVSAQHAFMDACGAVFGARP